MPRDPERADLVVRWESYSPRVRSAVAPLSYSKAARLGGFCCLFGPRSQRRSGQWLALPPRLVY